MRAGTLFLILGMLGCASPTILPAEQPREITPQEARECQKRYGQSAAHWLISQTEFICRIQVDDPAGGFSKLYDSWRMKAANAKNSGLSLIQLRNLARSWEASARRYSDGKCPPGFIASPIPLKGKIVCNSSVFPRSVIAILPMSPAE